MFFLIFLIYCLHDIISCKSLYIFNLTLESIVTISEHHCKLSKTEVKRLKYK